MSDLRSELRAERERTLWLAEALRKKDETVTALVAALSVIDPMPLYEIDRFKPEMIAGLIERYNYAVNTASGALKAICTETVLVAKETE